MPPALAETAAVPVRAVRDAQLGSVVIWRGQGESLVADTAAIRTGDTVVIPAAAGGFDLACLDPAAEPDVAEAVQAAYRVTAARLSAVESSIRFVSSSRAIRW